ncbi:hypothetical protein GGI12_004255, partial [Dipsacomyces acuminosporus]
MLGSRHQTVVKEIDTARCVGRWHVIGELAEKYAKYGPAGQVYSSIIVSEARLEEQLLAVTWNPKRHWKDEGEYEEPDGRRRIHTVYPMNASNAASLASIERDLVELGKKTMTKEEEYQHKVVLAKLYFYRGNYDSCRETLDSVPVDVEEDSLSPAYSKQLYMTQMVLRGITLEMQGDLMAAQSTYDKALSVFRSKLSPQAVVVVPRSSSHRSTEELVNWPEEALYRRALATLALGDKIGGVRELSDYIQQMEAVTPSTFRIVRRVRANRLLLQMLRDDIKAVDSEQLTQDLKNEVISCHLHQISMLKVAYSFPRAKEINSEVLDEVDSAAADWSLLLELLYQAVHLTYNSPRVMRHLVHALLRFGDYHEAGLAFGTYTVLVERQLESVKKAVSAALSGEVDKKLVFDQNTESIQAILETLAIGARLHLVHLSDAHECLSLLHFAHQLVDDVEAADPEHAIIPPITQCVKAQLLLWKGVAHGRLSQASREPDNRIHHHTIALQLLQQAVEQNPRSYEAHFQLALEQALGARDIAAATASAKQAVALDSKQLEAWHLLVLLSTSRKDYTTAQRICEVALKQSEWWNVYRDIQQGTLATTPTTGSARQVESSHLGLVSTEPNESKTLPNGTAHTPAQPSSARFGNIESGIAFFDLAMTQVLIEAQLKGIAASLKAQPHLFALYGCIYGPVIASGEGVDDVSAALEGSEFATMLSKTSGSTQRVYDNLIGSAEKAHSQMSGRRSIAKSLARSMFSKHARQRSANLAVEDTGAGSVAAAAANEADEQGALRKESSGPHPPHASLDANHPPIPAISLSDADARLPAQTAPLESLKNKSLEPKEPEYSAQQREQREQEPKRQRSMPHLRQSSCDSSVRSPDMLTESYYDNQGLAGGRASMGLSPGGSRSTTVAGVHGISGVYYTQVATKLSHQRSLASCALCSLWLNSAAAFVKLQRLEDAANAINEAISAWPESPDALTMRGQLELAQKQHFPALNEFHAAVSLESNNIRATVSLAHVEYLLGRRDVALGLLKNITRAHGWSDPEAWYWLGRLEREAALEQAEAGSNSEQG